MRLPLSNGQEVNMLTPIVVPLDGSMLAERALAPAKTLARRQGAKLYLVRVAPLDPAPVLAELELGVLYPDQALAAWQETGRYLAAVQKTCADADLPVLTEVREGDVAGEIVDTARQAGAGLIVMSSHGYSGVDRWLLGSTTERVLHVALCPVWVVRTLAAPEHLLITLDGSALAEQVLAPALEIAQAFEASVTLLRVIPELTETDRERLDDCEHGLSGRYSDEMLQEAAEYLNGIVERYRSTAGHIQTAVRMGRSAETIIDYAERHGIDLVAMTTHGRTGLRRWIYGSVTQKVLDQLPVSVLVSRSAAGALA
jgi:nucleotide-binding universal stress UspA family protein